MEPRRMGLKERELRKWLEPGQTGDWMQVDTNLLCDIVRRMDAYEAELAEVQAAGCDVSHALEAVRILRRINIDQGDAEVLKLRDWIQKDIDRGNMYAMHADGKAQS